MVNNTIENSTFILDEIKMQLTSAVIQNNSSPTMFDIKKSYLYLADSVAQRNFIASGFQFINAEKSELEIANLHFSSHLVIKENAAFLNLIESTLELDNTTFATFTQSKIICAKEFYVTSYSRTIRGHRNIKIDCIKCLSNTYILSKRALTINFPSSSKDNFVDRRCIKCPPGAICDNP